MIANSSSGLWCDIVIVLAARLRGFRVFVHHQVYSYLHRWDFRFAILNLLVGSHGVHIALSEEMSDQLLLRYRARRRILCVPNTVAIPVSLSDGRRVARRTTTLTIGHISNLSIEKGLGTVIETFRALRASGANVRLVLAGPTSSSQAAELVSQVVAEHPGDVEHWGPVYGSAKERFYASIDVFLFPTRYRNEAQPLVICESLLAGVPVLAYGLACIPSLIGATGGLSVAPNHDFVPAVLSHLSAFAADDRLLKEASRAAAARGVELRREAEVSLDRFLEVLCSVSSAAEEHASCSTRALVGV
jgi:glycosyltransferase involved in cell wall biosynthesis